MKSNSNFRSFFDILIKAIIISFFVLFVACDKEENTLVIQEGHAVEDDSTIWVIHDHFETKSIILAGSYGKNFIVSFINKVDQNIELVFSPVQDQLPIIMIDNEGNSWDIFGYAVTGPRSGQKLQPTISFMGYWFSWGAFFPGVEIYNLINYDTIGERVYASGEWLIPEKEVIDGGPGKDGIHALNNPEFINASQASYLAKDDLILGFKYGNEIRAYPHKILDWHEIINDEVGDLKIAVTYCPLTGTGIAWDRVIEEETLSFGVSGLLYNSNLIPFDRQTDSYWSQIRLEGVKGKFRGFQIKTYNLLQTTWGVWKEMFPETKVVSLNTGYNRPYDIYPYGFYRTSLGLYFPVHPFDLRFPPKEIVHGIVFKDKAKTYRFIPDN